MNKYTFISFAFLIGEIFQSGIPYKKAKQICQIISIKSNQATLTSEK